MQPAPLPLHPINSPSPRHSGCWDAILSCFGEAFASIRTPSSPPLPAVPPPTQPTPDSCESQVTLVMSNDHHVGLDERIFKLDNKDEPSNSPPLPAVPPPTQPTPDSCESQVTLVMSNDHHVGLEELEVRIFKLDNKDEPSKPLASVGILSGSGAVDAANETAAKHLSGSETFSSHFWKESIDSPTTNDGITVSTPPTCRVIHINTPSRHESSLSHSHQETIQSYLTFTELPCLSPPDTTVANTASEFKDDSLNACLEFIASLFQTQRRAQDLPPIPNGFALRHDRDITPHHSVVMDLIMAIQPDHPSHRIPLTPARQTLLYHIIMTSFSPNPSPIDSSYLQNVWRVVGPQDHRQDPVDSCPSLPTVQCWLSLCLATFPQRCTPAFTPDIQRAIMTALDRVSHSRTSDGGDEVLV